MCLTNYCKLNHNLLNALRVNLGNQDHLELRASKVSVATLASLGHQVKEASQVTMEKRVKR